MFVVLYTDGCYTNFMNIVMKVTDNVVLTKVSLNICNQLPPTYNSLPSVKASKSLRLHLEIHPQ